MYVYIYKNLEINKCNDIYIIILSYIHIMCYIYMYTSKHSNSKNWPPFLKKHICAAKLQTTS